jgi:hypothetical protein
MATRESISRACVREGATEWVSQAAAATAEVWAQHSTAVVWGSPATAEVGAQHSCGVGVSVPAADCPAPAQAFSVDSDCGRSDRLDGRQVDCCCCCVLAAMPSSSTPASLHRIAAEAEQRARSSSSQAPASQPLAACYSSASWCPQWHGGTGTRNQSTATKTLPGRLAVGGTSDAVGNISREWARPCRLLSGAMSDRKPR